GDDALAMIDRLGDRLTHLHLADGSGKTTKDEHLPPGEGNQPCAEVLRRLANRGWQGSVLLEINTRGLGGPGERERVLRQSLLFARHHLGHHLSHQLDESRDASTEGPRSRRVIGHHPAPPSGTSGTMIGACARPGTAPGPVPRPGEAGTARTRSTRRTR